MLAVHGGRVHNSGNAFRSGSSEPQTPLKEAKEAFEYARDFGQSHQLDLANTFLVKARESAMRLLSSGAETATKKDARTLIAQTYALEAICTHDSVDMQRTPISRDQRLAIVTALNNAREYGYDNMRQLEAELYLLRIERTTQSEDQATQTLAQDPAPRLGDLPYGNPALPEWVAHVHPAALHQVPVEPPRVPRPEQQLAAILSASRQIRESAAQSVVRLWQLPPDPHSDSAADQDFRQHPFFRGQ